MELRELYGGCHGSQHRWGMPRWDEHGIPTPSGDCGLPGHPIACSECVRFFGVFRVFSSMQNGEPDPKRQKTSRVPSPLHSDVEDNTILVTAEEKYARGELIRFVRRAYNQCLITASSGSFSCRVKDQPHFVITPSTVTSSDRGKLSHSELVLVEQHAEGQVLCLSVPPGRCPRSLEVQAKWWRSGSGCKVAG